MRQVLGARAGHLGAEESFAAVLAMVSRDAAGAEHRERFDYVLMAAGRAPNVDTIGIGHTGLALDPEGIPLFDRRTMHCGASHIVIAGDADNERPVLPEAANPGCIAGAIAGRYPDVRPGLRRTPLTIAFTEPQVGTLGAGDLIRHAVPFRRNP